MRDECLREIYGQLSREARQVWAVLDDGHEGYSVEQLMQATRLSTHRVRMALAELRGATLVVGGTPVRLASNGMELRALLKQGAE
jgi:hypothetical protein